MKIHPMRFCRRAVMRAPTVPYPTEQRRQPAGVDDALLGGRGPVHHDQDPHRLTARQGDIPITVLSDCALAPFAFSPTATYSLPSAPNASAPPL